MFPINVSDKMLYTCTSYFPPEFHKYMAHKQMSEGSGFGQWCVIMTERKYACTKPMH